MRRRQALAGGLIGLEFAHRVVPPRLAYIRAGRVPQALARRRLELPEAHVPRGASDGVRAVGSQPDVGLADNHDLRRRLHVDVPPRRRGRARVRHGHAGPVRRPVPTRDVLAQSTGRRPLDKQVPTGTGSGRGGKLVGDDDVEPAVTVVPGRAAGVAVGIRQHLTVTPFLGTVAGEGEVVHLARKAQVEGEPRVILTRI